MASSREEIAMKRTSPVTGGLAVLLIVCSVLGFSTDDAATSLGIEETLFDAEHPLELTLEADLKPVLRDRGDKRPDHPARLWYLDQQGDTVSFDIGVRTRGHYRRIYLDCNVPPLRLNFKKKAVKNTVFAGQDKLKLVTHCRDKATSYQQFTLQEYLIYKVYNLITDNSFRVRLVRITYVDTEGKRKPVTKYGFLIEDEDLLAKRLGGRILKTGIIHQEATHRDQATLLAVFQYMMGNTDWSVPGRHNIKFVFVDPKLPPFAVPYDFDFAGLVDPPYAKPDPRLQISSVRERLYRGYCRTEEEFQTAFAPFNEQREAIYALFRDFEYLDEKVKKRSLDYLDDFYETINKPRSVKREFLRACL